MKNVTSKAGLQRQT